MASYADRVYETTTTTGTGTYSLAGAAAGFRTFVAGVGSGSVVTYAVENGTDWEIGEGTVTDATPDTLSRTTILASSNAGAAVNWGAGTKNVFLTASANRTVFTDKTNTFAQPQAFPAGSATSPSITFSGDTNTGIFNTNDSVVVTAGGKRAAEFYHGDLAGNTDNTYIAFENYGGSGLPDVIVKSDSTNKGLGLYAKGNGSVILANGGGFGLTVNHSGTPYLNVNSYNTGVDLEIVNSGADTPLSLVASGTSSTLSRVSFYTFGGGNYRQIGSFGPLATITGVQNYISLNSSNPAASPTIEVEGGDTNINLDLFAKGTGAVQIGNNSGASRNLTIVGTGTQRVTLNNGDTFTDLEIVASSGNFSMDLTAYGSSNASKFNFYTFAGGSYRDLFRLAPSATPTGIQNFIQINSGNPTVAPNITATGGDTNINLDLFAKGTGSIRLNGTATTISSAGAISTSRVVTGTAGATFTNAIVSSGRGFASAEFSAGTGAPGTINWDNGQNQVRTLTSSGSLTLSNPVNGATYKLRIVQGGSGSYTITWPTIKWAGGAAPTLSTAVGAEDIITLYYNGTNYYGVASTGFA